MPIEATRALLHAALSGRLAGAEYRIDPTFGFEVPTAVPGVDSSLLDPRSTWADPAAYDSMAAKLVDLFVENFAQFADQRRFRPFSDIGELSAHSQETAAALFVDLAGVALLTIHIGLVTLHGPSDIP